MEWQHLITDCLGRVLETLEKALANTSQTELDIQPKPDCNSMGWITWHLTRTQDRSISNLIGDKQIWIKDEWFKKFKIFSTPFKYLKKEYINYMNSIIPFIYLQLYYLWCYLQ